MPDAGVDAARDTGLDAPLFDASDATVDVPVATPPWLEPWTLPARDPFPAAFLWGAASAAYQIEGQLNGTDWYQWEQMGRVLNADTADNGPRSFTHWRDDIAALVATGLTAYRFGIEQARLFPTSASWQACRASPTAAGCRAAADPAGLQYYHDVVAALRTANITPMVTLQHFVLPIYLDDLAQDWHQQGWLRDAIADDLGRYAGFVAAEFGSDVDWWVTLNEPTGNAVTAFLGAVNPPGQFIDTVSYGHAQLNMARAHVRMYDAIHAEDTVSVPGSRATGPAMVSITHHARRVLPLDGASARDRASADRVDRIYNRWFFDAIVRGNVDLNFDGSFAGEPQADPAYANRADYLGVNYYTTTVVQTVAGIPLLGALPRADDELRGLPKTEYGWDIYPRGFFEILLEFNAYDRPIVITENGLADSRDTNRARFIAEHLAALGAAMHAGVRVLGYFHWSIIDNLEWAAGYCPKFGLYAVDLTSAARTRTARPSAGVYSSIIRAGEVTDAMLSATAPYVTPARFCPESPRGADAGP